MVINYERAVTPFELGRKIIESQKFADAVHFSFIQPNTSFFHSRADGYVRLHNFFPSSFDSRSIRQCHTHDMDPAIDKNIRNLKWTQVILIFWTHLSINQLKVKETIQNAYSHTVYSFMIFLANELYRRKKDEKPVDSIDHK